LRPDGQGGDVSLRQIGGPHRRHSADSTDREARRGPDVPSAASATTPRAPWGLVTYFHDPDRNSYPATNCSVRNTAGTYGIRIHPASLRIAAAPQKFLASAFCKQIDAREALHFVAIVCADSRRAEWRLKNRGAVNGARPGVRQPAQAAVTQRDCPHCLGKYTMPGAAASENL